MSKKYASVTLTHMNVVEYDAICVYEEIDIPYIMQAIHDECDYGRFLVEDDGMVFIFHTCNIHPAFLIIDFGYEDVDAVDYADNADMAETLSPDHLPFVEKLHDLSFPPMLESAPDDDGEIPERSAVDGYNPDAQDEDFDGQQIMPDEVPYEEIPARDSNE